MRFLKRHFEKIILSAVLAGLGAAAFWLSVAVTEAKRSMTVGENTRPAAKLLPGVESNLAVFRAALQKLTQAPALNWSGEHNLFNPVTWKKGPDGRLVKMTRSGVDALEVTSIRPFYFIISLQSQAGEGFRLTAQPPTGPKMPSRFARPNEKPTPLQPYTIVGTNGSPENPSLLTLQLLIPETKEIVSVSTNAPYKRVVGYEADLRYSGSDATNRFLNKKVSDPLQFSGESFKIIAISSNAVTVQDARTAQKTEKEWKGGQ
jgi:hypothetical protein